MVYRVNGDLCICCEACGEACEPQVIDYSGDWAVIDEERCTGCGECVYVCPMDAIEEG